MDAYLAREVGGATVAHEAVTAHLSHGALTAAQDRGRSFVLPDAGSSSMWGGVLKNRGLVVGCVAAPVQLLAAAPAMAESVECTGALPPGTYPNIVVPEGQDCRLEDSTVNGNVVVRAAGGLIVQGSEINGNVRGSGAQYWGFTDTNGGDNTVINGNVEFVETIGNPAAGMASPSRYNFACEDTRFNGHVSFRNSDDLADFLFGSPNGSTAMPANPRGPDLRMQVPECSDPPMQDDGRDGNIVRDNYEALGNTGEVRQRDNIIRGHFSFFGNTAATAMDDFDIMRNEVTRHLTCQGNTPPPYQEGNTETGPGSDGDQCPTP